MTTTDLAVRNGTSAPVLARDPADLALRFVIPLDELRLQLVQLEEFKRDIMVEGVDYGTIPGTPKPTLLKPGAEKLTLVFGLAPSFTVSNRIEDWERGFFHYETKCDLVSKRTGEIVASAHGSANSKEPRYRWRDAKPTCPDCGFDLRRSKKLPGATEEAGWYCWGKIGGCGAQWPKETVKAVGRIENPEPYELVNTLLKMSEKRSLVAAALIATGGSGIWTMDIEDMPSVAGEDHIIDVPSGPPHTPTRERDVVDRRRPATPPATMVTSADDPMWSRWLELKSEADRFGVKIGEDVRLPIGRQLLQSAGLKVRDDLTARKAQLAKEDIDREVGEADHSAKVEMVKSAKAEIMNELAGLIEAVAAGGLDTEPYRVVLPAPVTEVRAKITAAQQALDAASDQAVDAPF